MESAPKPGSNGESTRLDSETTSGTDRSRVSTSVGEGEQWTPGPLEVQIDGTLTGVWASVVQKCVDPESGKEWDRELCRTETAYVRRDDAYKGVQWQDFDAAPEQYQPEPDCEETLANARLWAAAPDLYDALRRFGREYAASEGHVSAEAIEQCRAALSKAREGLSL